MMLLALIAALLFVTGAAGVKSEEKVEVVAKALTRLQQKQQQPNLEKVATSVERTLMLEVEEESDEDAIEVREEEEEDLLKSASSDLLLRGGKQMRYPPLQGGRLPPFSGGGVRFAGGGSPRYAPGPFAGGEGGVSIGRRPSLRPADSRFRPLHPPPGGFRPEYSPPPPRRRRPPPVDFDEYEDDDLRSGERITGQTSRRLNAAGIGFQGAGGSRRSKGPNPELEPPPDVIQITLKSKSGKRAKGDLDDELEQDGRRKGLLNPSSSSHGYVDFYDWESRKLGEEPLAFRPITWPESGELEPVEKEGPRRRRFRPTTAKPAPAATSTTGRPQEFLRPGRDPSAQPENGRNSNNNRLHTEFFSLSSAVSPAKPPPRCVV